MSKSRQERNRSVYNKTDLSFHNRENKFVAEPGEFKITVGDLSDTFELIAME